MAGITAPVTGSGAAPACTARVSNLNWARSFLGRSPPDGITPRRGPRPLQGRRPWHTVRAMTLTRREALQAVGAAALAPLASSLHAQPSSAPAPARPRIGLAVSTYSYWHFKTEKYPIEKVIDSAASLGFDGVEILHRQMAGESPAYLNSLKKQAFSRGLDLVMLSIHQDFVFPDKAERRKNVQHTERCIDIAAQLGIPAIRLNSGRWKTIKSFDDLMKVKGDEPPLSGYSNDEAIKWCVESIRECLPKAEKAGIVLALENHWGLTTSVNTLLRIWREVNSPWLGINLDTGNFPADP